MIDEAERSLHDALCVVRSLVKNRGYIPGGGAAEIEISQKLFEEHAKLTGVDQLIFRAYAEALEIIPYTLAENAGLNPIQVITDLRNKHSEGKKDSGISVRKGFVVDSMLDNNENVI